MATATWSRLRRGLCDLYKSHNSYYQLFRYLCRLTTAGGPGDGEGGEGPGMRDGGEDVEGEQRLLRAAVIGAPNAGKSTLVNSLLGTKVFAVSPKVHTTNRKAIGIFTEGSTQVVLLDTPGVIPYHYGRRLRVPREFLTDPQRSLMEAELVVVIVDASNKRTREQLDPGVLHALQGHPHIPSVLVLNKIDLLKQKHVLLNVTEALTAAMERQVKERRLGNLREGSGEEGRCEVVGMEGGTSQPLFKEVFMISALNRDGVRELRNYLVSCARVCPWEYSTGEFTDQPALALVEDTIREKLFFHLHKEIPYVITQDNLIWERNEDGVLVIYQNLTCKSSSQVSIVIGTAGHTIQTITAEAKKDIEALFECPVDLTLNVRASKK